tara:strand:+ start:168 stop:389 length:222 start_codon:yes stop_codon:yes gene_type:complete
MYAQIKLIMSSEIKFKEHYDPRDNNNFNSKNSVKLTDLLSRVKAEKKKERNSNIALSVAAVSAVTVFGIILSL